MSHFFPSNFLCIRCFFYTFLCNKLQCEFCAFNEKNLISYIICTLSKLITNEFLSVLFFFHVSSWIVNGAGSRHIVTHATYLQSGNLLVMVTLITETWLPWYWWHNHVFYYCAAYIWYIYITFILSPVEIALAMQSLICVAIGYSCWYRHILWF